MIPVYNCAPYLNQCLDSVLGQTLKDLEVIAVDDCSSDGCGKILDGYAAKDSRVHVIHLPENHRQGYARNRGIERATGEYLYFLDSDDMIVPEALSELCELADRDGLDAVFFDSFDKYESEDLKEIYKPPFTLRRGSYRNEIYSGPDLLDDFCRFEEWTCYPQRIIWRRKFIADEKIMYPEGSEHEDEFFAYAGILAAGRVRYMPRQYFILRVRPNSVMTSGYAPKNFHGYLMNYY
ncbi:MAG: glycosyltransferase family 2 protein, partial [Treponema sp.]|nr:glycosyltransferase family 2 protein [Treponema sp.]